MKGKRKERWRSVYIKGDTASLDWSGFWFVGLFYFFFYLDRVCKGLPFVSDGKE
jgi:hypothetical protein